MSAVDSIRDIIETAPQQLSEGRQAVRELHDRGLDGIQVCGRLSSIVDALVIRLYEAALAGMSLADSEAVRGQLAVVGLGSYGRRQSAPYSDVDLMFLHEARNVDAVTPLVRPVSQALYDVGLELGYSVRTTAEAVGLARTDPIICTSQIGCRLIAGNQQVFDRFRDDFSRLVRKRSRALCQAFHDARAEERRRYGETVYLLEPNVKRSRGALRDLHLLQWLGYVEHGEADLDRLHLLGAMSKFEYRRLTSARTYLLRLRNEMHFHAQSAAETLTRAEQIRVAEVFGHTRRAGLLPVEHFMRDYFRHTNHLWQMVRRREASLAAPSTMTRILDPVLGKNVSEHFRIGLKVVTATPNGLSAMRNSLEPVLKIVEASEKAGKPLDHATWSAMLLAAPECPGEITPAIAEQFMHLLDDPKVAAGAIRVLYELGYLEKIVPAMRHARCLLQFNQYHKFTVDEHSLRAVRAATEFRDRADALGAAYNAIRRKHLLHLALLLHDLGKGFEEDHSEVGRRIAEETCRRLLLSTTESAIVETLVHKHLLMAHLALRRDTSDPDELQRFVEEIGSGSRLRMLFVLTCADLAAVGPGVLNDWKVEVLADLYARTSKLSEVDETSHIGPPIDHQRRQVFETLSAKEQQDPWFKRQADVLPASYLAARDLEEIAEFLRRCRTLEPGAADAKAEYFPATRTVEIIAAVCEGVGRGVFSAMAGALSAQEMQILAADVEVLADSLLLLRYVVSDPTQPQGPEAERLDEVCQLVTAAVGSTEAPRFSKRWGQEEADASIRLTGLPIEVRIDNEASQKGTVVEVFTFDRQGLLYSLARMIHDLGLVIRHAKIGTYLDQVVDVFYVTDRDGQKVFDEDRLSEIRSKVLAIAEDSS